MEPGTENNMTKHTPLHSAHLRLGGKMVDFAGWDMPLHYGSQIEEHHHVRHAAGMFDVSHMLAIDLEGAGALALLLKLLANDVGKLTEPGRALYTCMLNPQGGVIDDLIVYFFRPDFYRLVVNAGSADKDVVWMLQHAGQVRVRARRDLAIIAVQGPQARAKAWVAFPGLEAASAALKPFAATWFDDMLVARTGYTGEDGFEFILPIERTVNIWNTLLDAGVQPIGLGARDTLRLEAGMNLYGQDMDEITTPLESGLAWTVSAESPRDFIGKAALADAPRLRAQRGLLLLDKGVLRAHQKVHTAHGAGEITSGGYSPTMNQSIALARLPIDTAVGDIVEVEIRDKRLKARVVKPPFVRNGTILI